MYQVFEPFATAKVSLLDLSDVKVNMNKSKSNTSLKESNKDESLGPR